MRIISGTLKGRKINVPSNRWKTRPTTDFAKESLFNILVNNIRLENINVLDLYSGTGNIAYEFVSRGARSVSCVEQYKPCVKFIQSTAQSFNIMDKMDIHHMDVHKYLKSAEEAFDVIFCDPPYQSNYNLLLENLDQSNACNSQTLIIFEHDENNSFEQYNNVIETRTYGQSKFSFITI